MSQTHPHAPDPAPLRSVSPPKQARSELTLQRLLSAAEALIQERDSVDDVSISEIAKRAKSSVGGFYARFRDKDELLLALHERFVRELEDRFAGMGSAADGTQLTQLLDEGVRLLVDVHRAHHSLLMAFAGRATHNRRLAETALSFRAQVIDRFATILLGWRAQIRHPDPELAAELAVQMALSFMEQTMVVGPVRARGGALSDTCLRSELSRMVLSYLAVPTPHTDTGVTR